MTFKINSKEPSNNLYLPFSSPYLHMHQLHLDSDTFSATSNVMLDKPLIFFIHKMSIITQNLQGVVMNK